MMHYRPASYQRAVGLGNILNVTAEPVPRLVFLSTEGEKLNEIRLDRITRRFSAPSFNVRRSELLSAVVREIGEEIITFGARCVGFEQDAEGVAVRFADGGEYRADLLVAADRAGSTLRCAIHGEDGKETRSWSGWQGVTSPGLAELTGRVGLFVLNGQALAGLYQLTDDRIHWFLDDPAPRRTSEDAPALEVP